MRDLPTGTVTFLFTDIEGSTKLLHELGDDYADALAEHRRLLREAFARHRGVEVDTQGDAFFIAFARATDALGAARDGQQALADGPIRVRMGLHTGEPVVTDEGYVGIDVHRAARIAAAGHGGQVLLSQATRSYVDNGVIDLGEHRLKDFDEAVPIFQLGSTPFPPLKTISNTNLPRPASSFVGREREVEEVRAKLQDGTRLLTLTGPGGSGKTRLAIEAAADLVPEFKAGVFWVGLAPLRNPALVADTIGQTLGADARLADHIGDRELLLVLDNLEQVVAAAPELAALVEACPNLRLLVTSRELLRVRGEVEYAVLPLADRDAVDLFCERAAVEADPSVVTLCRELENLPLALELAAARASVLSPQQIVERLSQRLDLFKGGRDADPRQRTLRATIEWSHELLAPDEQRLFARLGVFRGGCTLEAAEEVANAELDELQSLVDKSLLRRAGDGRLFMLETIREFAAERLASSGEEESTRRRLAEYVLSLATRAEPYLAGHEQTEWLQVLQSELANVREALDWSLDGRDPELGMQIAATLERFWFIRAPAEGFRWLEQALAVTSGDSTARAHALEAAGDCSWFLAAPDRALSLFEQALECYRRLGDNVGVARVLNRLGPPLALRGEREEAERVVRESLAMNRELDESVEVAVCLHMLTAFAVDREDWERAAVVGEEAVGLARDVGDRWVLAGDLYLLTAAALHRDDLPSADRRSREALRVARELGDDITTLIALADRAVAVKRLGDEERGGVIWGAAQRFDDEIGENMWRPDRGRYEALLDPRTADFERGVERGRLLELDEAVAHALGDEDA